MADDFSAQLEEQMRAVQRAFVESLPTRIGAVEAALAARDPIDGEPAVDVLRRTLHTLRGAAATLELDAIASATRAVEDALGADTSIDDAKRAELSSLVAKLRAIAI